MNKSKSTRFLSPVYKFAAGLCLWPGLGVASGTGVGNGGDALFQYLRSTQETIVSTLKAQLKNPKPVCNKLSNEDQINFCNENFKAIAERLIFKILQRPPEIPVDLILREEPLFVVGPDGNLMPVAARTALGASGAIEFHRPTLILYAPAQMVFLVVHEYLHKIPIAGSFRGDNEPLGPFDRGREFLDLMASEVQRLAQSQGRVGKDFLLIDYFLCEFDSEVSANSWNLKFFSLRSFLSPDLNQYQSGFGEGRRGGQVSRPYKDGFLEFSVLIHEPQACEGQTKDRFTRLRITKKYKDDRPDEILTEKLLEEFNPFCGTEQKPLELEYERHKFSCAYEGSESLLQGLKGPFQYSVLDQNKSVSINQ